jgi:polyisoprenoid-binding protein YceI
MPARSGTHQLGPEEATLSVHTKRGGAAAKAGHDLVIRVTSWRATLVVGSDAAETSVELSADADSLRVVEGSGGMQALGEDDKANIEQTIDDEVLEGRAIEFRSRRAQPSSGDGIAVEGELAIGDRTGPVAFDLAIGDDGALRAIATVQQSDWGIKPYSALLGALKVRDEVEVVLEGHL